MIYHLFSPLMYKKKALPSAHTTPMLDHYEWKRGICIATFHNFLTK